MRKIIAAGGLVLNDNNELLMIFRRGKWDLPKGKLDEGEKIEDCALREVKEETGLTDVKLDVFLGTTFHEYFDEYKKRDVIKETHWYKMLATGNQPLLPQTEEDIEIIEWVDKAEIPNKVMKSYKNITEIIKRLKD